MTNHKLPNGITLAKEHTKNQKIFGCYSYHLLPGNSLMEKIVDDLKTDSGPIKGDIRAIEKKDAVGFYLEIWTPKTRKTAWDKELEYARMRKVK